MMHLTGIVVGLLTIIALFAAALMQIALIRDRRYYESATSESCRWLLGVGLAGLGTRLLAVAMDPSAGVHVPWYSQLFVLLVAVGCFGTGLDKLIKAREAQPGGRRHEDPALRDPPPVEADSRARGIRGGR